MRLRAGASSPRRRSSAIWANSVARNCAKGSAWSTASRAATIVPALLGAGGVAYALYWFLG